MSQLKDIHVTYNTYGVGRLKAEMFDLWLRRSPSASWGDIIAGLTAMGEITVANKIEEHYTGIHVANVFIELCMSLFYSHLHG